MLVRDVVGEFELMKGHYFLHPLLPRRRRVRVDVHPLGHLRVRLPRNHPPAVKSKTSLRINKQEERQACEKDKAWGPLRSASSRLWLPYGCEKINSNYYLIISGNRWYINAMVATWMHRVNPKFGPNQNLVSFWSVALVKIHQINISNY